MLSRGRIFWLHAHPIPSPSPVSGSSRRHTAKLRKRDNLLTGGGGGDWVGEGPNTTAREPALYKSLNTLYLAYCNTFWLAHYTPALYIQQSYTTLSLGLYFCTSQIPFIQSFYIKNTIFGNTIQYNLLPSSNIRHSTCWLKLQYCSKVDI
jgi:hypothetical protein